MKKFLAMVLSLAMVSSLSVPVFAADGDATAPKLGEVTVNVTKVWVDGGYEENRPDSITVNVGDEEVVLSSENGWKGSVEVDAFDPDGTLKTYDVSEKKVDGYETAITSEDFNNEGKLVMKGFEELQQFDKVSECNSTTKYLENYNLAIFMKGDVFVLWTDRELTDGAKVVLQKYIEDNHANLEKDLDDLDDLDRKVPLTFVYGYDKKFELWDNIQGGNGRQCFTIKKDGTIQFADKATWAWFYRGNVAMAQDEYDVTVKNTYTAPVEPEEPKYEWVQTGSDSATGYDPEGRIANKGPWFMFNTVDVSEWEIGSEKTIDIQAGEWQNKKGTNKEHFVGTYTVTKTGENEYKISYEINGLDDTHKIHFDDPKLWVNETGKFTTSPGNQKGNATAVDANKAFEFDGDTLYIFAHFNVSYWEKVPVVDVAE